MQGLVVLAGAVLLIGGYFTLAPLIRKWVTSAVARKEETPIQADWRRLIERRMPAVSALTDLQRDRLLHAVRDLLRTRHWEGCGGLALTSEMQLIIAAQASLLTLELPGDPYPRLETLLVYPSTFVPTRAVDVRKWTRGSVAEPSLPELGEAWSSGTVVVAWDAALDGSQNGSDGRNVVIHEFAHLLDFQYRLTRGDPDLSGLVRNAEESAASPNIPGGDTWRQVMSQSFERHCAEVDQGTAALLDRYAATNEAEFFAVSTEVFFERPAGLRAAYPLLYEQLSRFFGQDPAGRTGASGP
jgi:Mlc titration factor MtfA (ptsG expression regulator)